MDGVIVDSEPVWQEARQVLVEAHGSVWTKEDGDACRGRASSVWSARISDRLDGALTSEEVFAEVVQWISSAYERDLPLFDGAVEAIKEVASTYKVGIASGSPNVLIDLVVERTGLGSVVSAVGYGDEVERGKPAPDIYLGVLDRLGVEPSQAVGVEDSVSGLRSVIAAGMSAVAITSPEYRLPEDVLERTALQLEHLGDLTLPMLDSLESR